MILYLCGISCSKMTDNNLTFALTDDGSSTIFNASIGEHYHSRHGALQESRHVFLKSGLEYYLGKEQIKKADILEVGFGTGLNFLLTADYSLMKDLEVHYTGIEAYPLPLEMITKTGYEQYLSPDTWNTFLENYPGVFTSNVAINRAITLAVAECKLLDFNSEKKFDVLYFDAFAAIHQPEMWTDESLSHICSFLKPGGVFVTYAITGNLKRSMKGLGFSIEKAQGAPGKREMLRAVKIV
jgi:tRNA U34 5-methylaminomethyl-2-thiouridine-forming methyltransferase MnmC